MQLSRLIKAAFLDLISRIFASRTMAQEYSARLSIHWWPKHHSAIHTQMFADEVNKITNGRLKIDVFPSRQLFGIRKKLGAITSQAIEMEVTISFQQ